MPFPKMSGCITGIFEKMSDCSFLGPNRIARSKDSITIGVTPGQHTSAGRRTTRLSIKIIETQTRKCHLVQIGCLNIRMMVIPNFLPTMIIPHQENNIGFGFFRLKEESKR